MGSRMKNILRALTFAFMAQVLAESPLYAVSLGSANLTVLTAPGAEVVVSSASPAASYTHFADATGTAVFSALAPGDYEVRTGGSTQSATLSSGENQVSLGAP
jgi:hypothetical protein